MLLRLLPSPSSTLPTPPTILFTLPLPTHPYTSKSLPLPPNLMAHRSVCVQEDIECNNVLLGEKSSWISGIVDDITFSLPKSEIAIHLVDNSEIVLPLTSACIRQLESVIFQVQLSFTAPTDTPKRSTLLSTLLSPLLSSASNRSSSPSSPHSIQPARVHRRQARSLLVDAYRLHVLPSLKERLPSAYLLWSIESEVNQKLAEFEQLRAEIHGLLQSAGVDSLALKRCESSSSCFEGSSSSSSSSSSDCDSPVTPATSVFSLDSSSHHSKTSSRTKTTTPQSFLLSIPPAHSISSDYRTTYSTQLARLTHLASRIGSIKKLATRYEREESKRAWLDSLEAGRNLDKAMRRAWSNGHLKGFPSIISGTASSSTTRGGVSDFARPLVRSKLWRDLRPAELEPIYTYDDLLVAEAGDNVPALSPSASDDSLTDSEWDQDQISSDEDELASALSKGFGISLNPTSASTQCSTSGSKVDSHSLTTITTTTTATNQKLPTSETLYHSHSQMTNNTLIVQWDDDRVDNPHGHGQAQGQETELQPFCVY